VLPAAGRHGRVAGWHTGVFTASGHRRVIARLDDADRSGGHVGARAAAVGGHGTKEMTPCMTR